MEARVLRTDPQESTAGGIARMFPRPGKPPKTSISHAAFYRFPAEMEDPRLQTLFVSDNDTTNPLRPQPDFLWW
jgi:hypothetical protein